MDGDTWEVLWYQQYASPEGLDESAYDIAADSAGNALITGRQLNGEQGDDVMTMKFAASDGEILWRVHHGGLLPLDDRAWSIVVGPDQHPVVTGMFSTPTDPARYCTIKLNTTNGSTIWERSIPGAINHIDREAGWLTVCDNGDIVMANRTWTSATSYDVVLHRYAAATGDTVWTTQYNSSGTDGDDPVQMICDAAGNLLVTGSRSGDFMVLKFDQADGSLIWPAFYDGPAGGYDSGAAIIEGPGGEVIVTGFSSGADFTWDVTTVAFDPATGAQLWVEHYDPGDGRSDEGKALTVSAQGDLYVTGYGDLVATGSDLLAIRYSLPMTTGITDEPVVISSRLSPLSITSHPNPFTSEVFLSVGLHRQGRADLAVYDVRGRRTVSIHSGVLPRGTTRLTWDGRDASGRPLATGVYFVRLESAGLSAVRKVVLNR